jgi:hypothetical protein
MKRKYLKTDETRKLSRDYPVDEVLGVRGHENFFGKRIPLITINGVDLIPFYRSFKLDYPDVNPSKIGRIIRGALKKNEWVGVEIGVHPENFNPGNVIPINVSENRVLDILRRDVEYEKERMNQEISNGIFNYTEYKDRLYVFPTEKLVKLISVTSNINYLM